MTFQTLSFVALLLAVLALYWLLRRREQNILLLVASYVFYGYVDPLLALLLGGFTLVMYATGLNAASVDAGELRSIRRRKISLGIAIAAAIGVIVVFKYLGFFVDEAGRLAEAVGFGTFSNHLNIILPVGVSFYTLQALSYVIDVYRGRVAPRRNLLNFALFVSFFPQLVAGPIERASRLLPQFESRRSIDSEDIQDAATLILWGFFKKLVIADNVGVIADAVFATESPGFSLLWVGVLAFGLQIFADFSGYTDIARGTARLFGIKLSTNFDHPHMARSPVDFWRRWHISLSTWFRDYVYIPMGGSRRGELRVSWNILATFLLSGLWHGAAWNFLAWGGYHGLLVIGQRAFSRTATSWTLRVSSMPMTAPVITFVLISVGWLFFREGDFGHIVRMLGSSPFEETAARIELAAFLLLQVVVYSLPIWIHTAIDRFGITAIDRREAARWFGSRAVIASVLFTSILVMRSASGGEFIYFRF